MSEQQPLTLKSFLLICNVLYFSLLTGVLLMLAVFVFFVSTEGAIAEEEVQTKKIFQIGLAVAGLGMYFLSNYLYNSKTKQISSTDSLFNKLQAYRTALLISLVLLEFVLLLAVILYFMFGDLFFLAFIAMMLAFYGLKKPSKSEIFKVVPLTSEEKEKLNNQEPITP